MSQNRSEPYLSAYLHSRGASLGIPVSGTFELTARCNFSCPMCYIHGNGKDGGAAPAELTARQWIGLAEQAKEKGMVFALLTGGEPVIRKDFFEIYEAMKAMGLMICLNTNGSLLSGAVRQRLLENPPFRVNVSLYGGCRDTYRSMCGQDAFEAVTQNIRALKAAGVDVRLNLAVTPHNRGDMERIYQIARELGVHIKASSYMYPSIRTGSGFGCGNRLSPDEAASCSVQWDLLRLTPEEFAQRGKNLKEMTAEPAGQCAADTEEGVICRAGSTSFWIAYDGRMLPCGMMPEPVVHPLETGFDAAWEQLRAMTRKIRLPQECAACPRRKVCNVCAAVCVTETGSFGKVPEYMCRMTDETICATRRALEEREGWTGGN